MSITEMKLGKNSCGRGATVIFRNPFVGACRERFGQNDLKEIIRTQSDTNCIRLRPYLVRVARLELAASWSQKPRTTFL